MNDMKEITKQARLKVLKEMQDKDVLDEAFLYAIPYDEFYLTQPQNSNEVAAKLENVILVAKEKIVNHYGQTKRVFELYNSELQKIGTGEENEKFKSDKEILEELLKDQQKKLDELDSSLKVAGLDSLDGEGKIESYFEMINRKLVVMNKEQKEKLDTLREKQKSGFGEINNEDEKDTEHNEEIAEEIEKNNINNKEDAETIKQLAEDDLEFKISKVTPIVDDLFYENNPQISNQRAYLIMDTHMRPQIITMQNGKFEKAPGFKEATARTGEADILRNDDKNIETKNTYGEITKNNNGPDSLTYSIEIGQYGEPKLLEKRPNKGSKIEARDHYLVREVQTNNTDYDDINREGDTVKNITRESFKEYGYTDDSHPNSISQKRKSISKDEDLNDDRESDFTPEDLADSNDIKVNNAIEKITSKLKEDGINLSSEEQKEVKEEVSKIIQQKGAPYCDEEIEKYCENYIAEKEQKEKQTEQQQESKDEGRSRLEEAYDRMVGRR